jgi:hypothetical protein
MNINDYSRYNKRIVESCIIAMMLNRKVEQLRYEEE